MKGDLSEKMLLKQNQAMILVDSLDESQVLQRCLPIESHMLHACMTGWVYYTLTVIHKNPCRPVSEFTHEKGTRTLFSVFCASLAVASVVEKTGGGRAEIVV